MPEGDQHNRWRCTVVGCNPILKSQETMESHRAETGHRVAKWPIRSAAGKLKAKARNQSGYYDKYNIGIKAARLPTPSETLVSSVNGWGCLNPTDGQWFPSGGGGFGYPTNCGDCDWCEDNDDSDNEFAFGEDDF